MRLATPVLRLRLGGAVTAAVPASAGTAVSGQPPSPRINYNLILRLIILRLIYEELRLLLGRAVNGVGTSVPTLIGQRPPHRVINL